MSKYHREEKRIQKQVEKRAQRFQGLRPTTPKERRAIQSLGIPLLLPCRLILSDLPSIALELIFLDNDAGDEYIDMDALGDVSCSFVRFSQLPDDLRIKLWGYSADREQYHYVFATVHEALELLYKELPYSMALPPGGVKSFKSSKKVNAWNHLWVEHVMYHGDDQQTVCSPITVFFKRFGGPGFRNHANFITKHPISGRLPDFRNNLLEMARQIYTKNATQLKNWPNTYRAVDEDTTTKDIRDDIAKTMEAAQRELDENAGLMMEERKEESKEEKVIEMEYGFQDE